MVNQIARWVGSVLAAAAILTTGAAWAAAPDWVLLDENQDSRFYYDQSGPKPHEGMTQVRTRVVYSDEGKADAVKILGNQKKYQALFESHYQHQVDCTEGRSRLLEATHLDEQGAVLNRSDLSGVTSWEQVPAGERMSLVLEKVCTPVAPGKK
ncbi:hypothetical protein GMLC_43200 [Geomonas limicola]|uniref:Surface-adhesin protein E-like domain-containing protein n=1 Tax=Geomonas limicola TaxID=2740186 RepID=A0A6V8NDW0_9BACT|nr:surface-adhesin E family protein [Geomonas limicola]GFO70741.1 hypothetical protein GMLC_43200 [Geomonas limicola]